MVIGACLGDFMASFSFSSQDDDQKIRLLFLVCVLCVCVCERMFWLWPNKLDNEVGAAAAAAAVALLQWSEAQGSAFVLIDIWLEQSTVCVYVYLFECTSLSTEITFIGVFFFVLSHSLTAAVAIARWCSVGEPFVAFTRRSNHWHVNKQKQQQHTQTQTHMQTPWEKSRYELVSNKHSPRRRRQQQQKNNRARERESESWELKIQWHGKEH